jgi:DNA uptake protein ComE-like DNA-binding protein
MAFGAEPAGGRTRRQVDFRAWRYLMVRLRITAILVLIAALVTSSSVLAQTKQVDINSASEEEMVAIGIDKAAARKIIEARPYRNKTELVSRQLLTRAQYDKLKDSLIARQQTNPPAK